MVRVFEFSWDTTSVVVLENSLEEAINRLLTSFNNIKLDGIRLYYQQDTEESNINITETDAEPGIIAYCKY